MPERSRAPIAATFLVILSTWLPGPSARGQDDFPDDLVRWKPSPVAPVFKGEGGTAWDQKIRERGWIARDGGTFHLWYTGYNVDRKTDKFLGHATSPDGLAWTRDPANPLHATSWVEDVCVLKVGATFWMFAEGRDDIAHRLISADGRSWWDLGPLDIRDTHGQPIPPGPRGTPTAWFEDGVWSLFYERGDRGVWLARSNDGVTFTNVQDDPVVAMGPEGAYDSTAVAINQVFKRGGVYYAVYHANKNTPWKDWSTCIARSRDLVHWEKYPGNPIVGENCSSGMIVETADGPRLYTAHPEVRRFEPAGR